MTSLCTEPNFPNYPFEARNAWEYEFLSGEGVDVFNLPLYQRLKEGHMFVAVALVKVNVDRLLAAYGDKVWRGAQLESHYARRNWHTVHRQLLFQLAPDCFLFVNTNMGCLRVFARDAKVAQRTVRELADRFRVRNRRTKAKGVFHLLSLNEKGVGAASVEVDDTVKLRAADLGMLYGDGFPAWDVAFKHTLGTARAGTAILRGPPGTGKTTYIRSLVAQLATTHRFYYLPATSFHLLSSPSLVEFWANGGLTDSKIRRVVILEDAEELLADRGDGARGQVANLLNISDGLLGDFLKMKLVCTVNCPLDRLDPAITRSGRLLASWEFKRLPRDRAALIAEAHNLTLADQEDYSLAEVFCGRAKMAAEAPRRTLGFGAAASG